MKLGQDDRFEIAASIASFLYSTREQITLFAAFGEGLWEPPPQHSGGGPTEP
jgi:hypothetical protein